MDKLGGLLESLRGLEDTFKEKRPRSKCCKAITYTAGDKGFVSEICSDCGKKIRVLTET